MNLKYSRIAPFFLGITVLVLTSCNSVEDNKEGKSIQKSKMALTYSEQMDKPLIVTFSKSKYEVLYKSDSSFQWKSLKSEAQEDMKSKIIVLDDYRVLTNWVESDSTIVSILTDFENMTVNGFETFPDYKSTYLIGKLTEKN